MTNQSDTKVTGEVNKVDRSIDRHKTCPLLLRVFWNKNRHRPPSDYDRGHIPANELQIYTWMDATLGELTQLMKDVIPDVGRRGVQFAFAVVYPDDSYNRYRVSEIGVTENGKTTADDNIQLRDRRFHVGDYLDVAIIQRRNDKNPSNPRRDRPGQQISEENNKRRPATNQERNGPNSAGPVRSNQRNADHRHQPY